MKWPCNIVIFNICWVRTSIWTYTIVFSMRLLCGVFYMLTTHLISHSFIVKKRRFRFDFIFKWQRIRVGYFQKLVTSWKHSKCCNLAANWRHPSQVAWVEGRNNFHCKLSNKVLNISYEFIRDKVSDVTKR